MNANLDLTQIQSDDDSALLEQGRRIRTLHEIISRPDLSFDQQIDETLRLGCKLFGTEIGKVGRQDPENNKSEFLNTVVMSDLPAKRGIILPLDKTFCQVTFSSPETIAISHVKESEFKDHPAAEFLGMQSYIGCSINVHGRKFGTVNFSNREPVAHPFTEADNDLVNLIGSWISVMMERQLDAEELNKAKDAAEIANQAKSSFLANMSHEIRTPLTAIIGFTDEVLNDDQSADERETALKIIQSSSQHLLSLINDVLDISKIESGELDIDESNVELRPILNDVLSIISGQAKQKNVKLLLDFKYPYPAIIKTDELRFKQILLNLCSNSIKFTSEGSITLEVIYHSEDEQLDINVKDTGIGMTAEQCEKVFKPFVQADSSTTKKYGGTGLGLSLSRKLAENLNGTLTASSDYGKGSTFTLIHPIKQSETDQFKLITSTKTDTNNKPQMTSPNKNLRVTGNILLADDSEMNQHLLSIYLKKIGANVDIADNGQIALSMAQNNNYDLILMDMMMPVMSGVEALRLLRRSEDTTPVVMLSANVTMEDKKTCAEAGSNEYLTKPIDKPKFYEMVARYLKPAEN